MRRVLLVALFLTLALVISPGWQMSHAQPSMAQYYPEYGHWVSDEFLLAYLSVPNPEELYGLPISRKFLDESIGRYVQYFEKARFELYPEEPPGQQVKITAAGLILHAYAPGAPIADDSADCLEFPEIGLRVCRSFKDFFEANGGVEQFGQPVSGLELINDRRVQYFEKARFEWHPEFPAGKRIKVGDLGLELATLYRVDSKEIFPEPGREIGELKRLKASAYPLHAVISPGANQSVYVIVQDQRLFEVSGATVGLDILYPSGEQEHLAAPVTDENGVAWVDLSVGAEPPGMAEVRVTVTLDTPVGFFETKTITSFRIWR